jgi:hypothetical protein
MRIQGIETIKRCAEQGWATRSRPTLTGTRTPRVRVRRPPVLFPTLRLTHRAPHGAPLRLRLRESEPPPRCLRGDSLLPGARLRRVPRTLLRHPGVTTVVGSSPVVPIQRPPCGGPRTHPTAGPGHDGVGPTSSRPFAYGLPGRRCFCRGFESSCPRLKNPPGGSSNPPNGWPRQ